jgi:hypothetical protein
MMDWELFTKKVVLRTAITAHIGATIFGYLEPSFMIGALWGILVFHKWNEIEMQNDSITNPAD